MTAPSLSSVSVLTPSFTVPRVALVVLEQKAGQLRGRAGAHHQQARREPVKGAGMADLAGAGDPLHFPDRFVGGLPFRLVDEEYRVQRVFHG